MDAHFTHCNEVTDEWVISDVYRTKRIVDTRIPDDSWILRFPHFEGFLIECLVVGKGSQVVPVDEGWKEGVYQYF